MAEIFSAVVVIGGIIFALRQIRVSNMRVKLDWTPSKISNEI